MGLKATVWSGEPGLFRGGRDIHRHRKLPSLTNPCAEIPLGQHEMNQRGPPPELPLDPDTFNTEGWDLGPWEDIDPCTND